MDASSLRAIAGRMQAWLDVLLPALLIFVGIARLGAGLDHPSIHNWDESAHQAATRGAFVTPLRPHIFEHPVYPGPPKEWMESSVFLHKPTGPFWFGALAMHLLGVTPLALRLGSLLGELAAALAIYLLGSRFAGRAVAFAGGLAFLLLPFGYELTQGYLFGDATDCTLAGWVATAIVLLVLAVERQDARLAGAAGFATGLAYLCKTALGLAPAGVAVVFLVLGWRKWTPGLTLRRFGWFALALLVTAVPWNAYCAYAFPAEYQYEAHHTLAHLFSNEIAQWVRPADAIVNEINEGELRPLPIGLPLLALLWGIVRSVRRREPAVIATTLWVGASWVVLSIASTKVPGVAWGAVPGAVLLIAILLGDAVRTPALAGAVLGALLTPRLLVAMPSLDRIPTALPVALVETRTHPVLLVGLLLAALGALIAFGLGELVARLLSPERAPPVRWVAQGVGTLAVFLGLLPIANAQAAVAATESRDASTAPMRELGLAIDQALPKGDALLFSRFDRDPSCCFLRQDLSFWSGKTNYRHEPDLPSAQRWGLHPYLVSVAAEPFAPVPGIPAFAAARVYDLEQPAAEVTPLPPDATRVDVAGRDWHAVAWSAGERDRTHDVWSVFLEGASTVFSVALDFETAAGHQQVTASNVDTYSDPKRWVGRPWIVVTVAGPRRRDVSHLRIGGVPVF